MDNAESLEVQLQPTSIEIVIVSLTVTASGQPYSCLGLRCPSWPRTLATPKLKRVRW